ncbi:MAG: hypothetical protein QME69_03095 [Candidatus Saccharicenans sp.]|nr:hypothetical protein [Candidatus Saccharicenans sp.]
MVSRVRGVSGSDVVVNRQLGKTLRKPGGLIKMALEKAGLPPLKVLLKLLTERRKPEPK